MAGDARIQNLQEDIDSPMSRQQENHLHLEQLFRLLSEHVQEIHELKNACARMQAMIEAIYHKLFASDLQLAEVTKSDMKEDDIENTTRNENEKSEILEDGVEETKEDDETRDLANLRIYEMFTEETSKEKDVAAVKIEEALHTLKDGQVIAIHSGGELHEKLSVASKTSRLAILYFTATWCGPCRYISPLFTSLAEKYPKVVFLKVDIDVAADVAARMKVSSIPSFFFVKDGEEIDKLVGADKGTLERKIGKYTRS